ncbi:MAG: hypothetical protein E7673_07415 [Ruminococcaceae bacterium]|nr:hypothetical protein [Oscillospiraceae bacterium]
MEKTSSLIKALICAALLAVILVSLFLPVVKFNSAEKFNETKIGYYHVDLAHAGEVKVSLASLLFSCGRDVNTMIKLYKIDSQIADLEELREDKSADKDKGLQSNRDEMQAEIDALNVKIDALEAEKSSMMSSISGTEADTRIQSKLNDKSFLKKIALRAVMYNVDKDSSYITFAAVVSLLALAILIADITLKLIKLIKAGFKFSDDVVKALTDFKLPIVAFILHMFTVQHYISKTRGVASLGSGIIIGLVAMIAFAAVRGVANVLEAKAEGGEKFTKTLIKQSITAGVLIITVVIALIGMRMSRLMIMDMQNHYPEFVQRYNSLAVKLNDTTAVKEKVSESMSVVVSIIAAMPSLIYAALGYMLARVGVVEKVRFKKSRKPVTPLGSFYIGFIFVAVAYLLTLVIFTVDNSQKRYEMYGNCQMSVVFTEYKEEGTFDNTTHKYLCTYRDEVLEKGIDELKAEYKDTDDKETKAEIKAELENARIELSAVKNQIKSIEGRKKSNMIFVIALATVAIAAEIVFKNIKFEAEKIAESGKEN